MAKHEWHWGEGATAETQCGKLNVSLQVNWVARRASNCSLRRERLSGGLRQGVELITLDNGALRLAICPTRGMGLWKAWLGELELGWQSPNAGPVHPALGAAQRAKRTGLARWLR